MDAEHCSLTTVFTEGGTGLLRRCTISAVVTNFSIQWRGRAAHHLLTLTVRLNAFHWCVTDSDLSWEIDDMTKFD